MKRALIEIVVVVVAILLLGFYTGLSEALRGVIIGGLISYFATTYSARIQTEAAERQAERQLKFQKEQAENAKLVELRTAYLNPLVEQLQELYRQSISLQEQFSSVDPDNPYSSWFGTAGKQRHEVIEGCRHTLEEMASIDNRIEELQVRISDSALNKMLHEISLSIAGACIYLLSIAGTSEKKDEDAELRLSIGEIKKIMDALPKTNKRIEELLSGMD